MRTIPFSLLAIMLCGCSGYPVQDKTGGVGRSCLGSTELPADLADKFDPVEDSKLLSEALGKAKKGKLCQGRTYKSKEGAETILFRAWNSTNPASRFGKWWAFQNPSGKVSDYRADYEICYQWSPLDKLVSCTLKPGTRVVVGTGQSAECSKYLTYPVSAEQQIYIDDAVAAFTDCAEFDGEFSWK